MINFRSKSKSSLYKLIKNMKLCFLHKQTVWSRSFPCFFFYRKLLRRGNSIRTGVPSREEYRVPGLETGESSSR